MTRPDEDPKAGNTKVDVKEEAQRSKMDNAAPPLNPNKVKRTNEPNAGGSNREAGDRSG